MIRVALQMLTGDRVKFLGLVLGVTFSTLLCVQQSSIFVGVLRLSTYLISSNPTVDVWVMRPGVEGLEWVQQMPDQWLKRVSGIEGVEWAVPVYRGTTTVRTRDQRLRLVQVIGVDDATLVGAPGDMIAGSVLDLRRPDAVIMDVATFKRLLPDVSPSSRPTIEIGKRHAVVVGVCRAAKPITGGDLIFARRSVAANLAQEPNETLSFVMVRAAAGVNADDVAARIRAQTGLQAHTSAGFSRSAIGWTLANTGVAQVLGSVIVLGLAVGVLVVGQTFYLFAYENRRYFATLKAMGASSGVVARMIVCQGLVVGFIGYGIGAGCATAILVAGDTDLSPMRGLSVSGPVLLVAGAVLPAIVVTTALLGGRGAMRAEPGVVFKG
jgi:putative ABC transport system permease protein